MKNFDQLSKQKVKRSLTDIVTGHDTLNEFNINMSSRD